MKRTILHSMSIGLISAVACLSVAACGDNALDSTGDGDETVNEAEQALISAKRRISYWPSKVNVHTDSTTQAWTHDANCSSGSQIDPLQYCKYYYPNTVSVTSVGLTNKPPLIWNTAGCGQQYTNKGTYEWTCDEPGRIATFQGKVNLHRDPGGVWVHDTDCSSGAEIPALTYCKKFYPLTTSVKAVLPLSAKPPLSWNTAGCLQQYSGDGEKEWLCQEAPRIAYLPRKVNAHRDPGGNWVPDENCSSGSQIPAIDYCKTLYPNTTSVTSVPVSPKPPLLWNTAGCGQQYSGDGVYEWTCNQP